MNPSDLIDTLPDEAACRQAFATSCRRVGARVPSAWPIPEGDALALIREVFELDARPAVLAQLEGHCQFTPPPDGQYTAREVTHLALILDSLRFWKPSPSLHDTNRGECGVELSNAIQAGPDAVKQIADRLIGQGIDLRRALLMLVMHETRQSREVLYWCAVALLMARGVHV